MQFKEWVEISIEFEEWLKENHPELLEEDWKDMLRRAAMGAAMAGAGAGAMNPADAAADQFFRQRQPPGVSAYERPAQLPRAVSADRTQGAEEPGPIRGESPMSKRAGESGVGLNGETYTIADNETIKWPKHKAVSHRANNKFTIYYPSEMAAKFNEKTRHYFFSDANKRALSHQKVYMGVSDRYLGHASFGDPSFKVLEDGRLIISFSIGGVQRIRMR